MALIVAKAGAQAVHTGIHRGSLVETNSSRHWMLALLTLCAWGCSARQDPPPVVERSSAVEAAKPAPSNVLVRTPAVAGLFYPGDKAVLSSTLDRLLQTAPANYVPHLRALVCPHAGYEYSGLTAAFAYRTVAGRPFETVVVMGPSHYALFEGASIPNAGVYETPLGVVNISEKAAALLKLPGFVLEPRCSVQRPDWWRQSRKSAPPVGEDTPETWEHSVEVQVPFLQKTLPGAKILPILEGEADPEKVAAGLAQILDDKTLIVASSDLSHYHPYDIARVLDKRCVDAICRLDIADMKLQEACGKMPILTLMFLAKQKGWKTRLLDWRNSGDMTGQKDRVVGYSAIAFYEAAPEKVSAQERQLLLKLARQSLACAATNGPPPALNADTVSSNLSESRGCFVTLTENGNLRGCIGHIVPQEALWRAVVDNAQSAASRDPRFEPVRPAEVDKIKIEISVLTVPQPLLFDSPQDLLNKLKPCEDGVVLRIGVRGATYLPQVWAQLPDKVEFLNHLSEKAGCALDAWRGGGTSVSIYHVDSFEESE
jgi:AmmeMemoRadiSam system protein A